MYEVAWLHSVVKPRIPRSWLEHSDDENWDLIDTEIESWVVQDLLVTCASIEPVSEQDYCQIGMTAIVMGDVNAVFTLACVHRRQLARCARTERTLPADQSSLSRARRRLETCTLMILLLSVSCNLQTCMSVSSPIEVQRADALYGFFQMPTNAGESGSTLAGEFWGWRLRHTRIPSSTPSCAHAHRDAGRCCGRKSDASAAPPGRVGVRPRFSARSVRLPRRVLHCSRDFDSKQTISSEWSSARRASTCHRACFFVAVFAGRTLREAPRYQMLHHMVLAGALRQSHLSPGSPCTIWPKSENTCALIAKARNHQATCTMDAQPLFHLSLELNWATMFPYRFFKGKQPHGSGEPNTGTAALGSCGFACGFENRPSQRTIKLTNSQLLASKTGVSVLCLWHRGGVIVGAHLGESGRCLLTKQAN